MCWLALGLALSLVCLLEMRQPKPKPLNYFVIKRNGDTCVIIYDDDHVEEATRQLQRDAQYLDSRRERLIDCGEGE